MEEEKVIKTEEKKSIFSTFIQKPVLAWVINICIMLLGIVAWQKLDVRELPQITFPTITIKTEYAGAGAEIVESQVTIPLEESLTGIEGLDYMQSSSTIGNSTITLNFTSETNTDAASANVRDRISQAKNSFPPSLREPVISKSGAHDKELMRLATYGEKYNLAEIADYMQRHAKGQLESIPGVASVQVSGGGGGSDSGAFQIHALILPEKMHAMDVTVRDIREAISQSSFKKPLGEINQSDISYTITLDQAAKSIEDYANIIIKNNKLGNIKLSDVTEVKFMTNDPDTRIRYNGKPCVTTTIIPQQTANPMEIAKNVRIKLEEIKKNMPRNLKIEISSDSSESIKKSINEVYYAIFEAILFVFLVIFLFLKSWKSTLIPMITIPICILGGFFIIYMLGYTINTLTLLAIVLAIGLVVDDAIIVLENIHRYIEKGLTPLAASIKGIKEIEFSVIAMTLTLMAVYAPITLASGMVGKLFTEFAVTLAGTVLISGVVALVLTPMLCSRILKKDEKLSLKNKKLENFFVKMEEKTDNTLNKIDENYKKYLNIAIKKSNLIMISAIIFGLASALTAAFYIPKTLKPEIDTGYIILNLEGPSGATALYSDKYASKIEKAIKNIPLMENYLLSIQSRSGRNFIQIKLKDLSKRNKSCKAVLKEIDSNIGKLQSGLRVRGYCSSGVLGGASDTDKTVSFVLQSQKSYDEIENVARKIISLLRTHPNVDPSIRVTRAMPEKAFNVKINKEKAALLNVRMQDAGEMLSFVLRGQPPADRFEKDGKRYPMRVLVSEDLKKDPENYKKLHVRATKASSNDKQPPLVSLHELLEIKETKERPMHARYEGMRSYEIIFEVKKGSSVNFYNEFTKVLDQIIPTGYKYSPTGDIRKAIKEGQNITMVFILAILFIFLILAAQFESFIDPLIIMFSVPLALGGGILILALIPETSLNIFTYIALVTLIGLITKHGILIVDFANKKLLEKAKVKKEDISKAITEAATLRLRPILMTTAAMILGALPLALSRSAGYEMRSQIGYVIIAGMFIGTLFTIFVVPCFYKIVKTYTYSKK